MKLKNLLTVLETVRQLQQKGWEISEAAVHKGLAQVKKLTGLHGRWDIIHTHPLVVLDVAHNPHAALMLADGLGDMGFFQNTLAVFSMLRDKDARGVVDAVKHRVDAWYVGRIDSARGANVNWLATQITELAPSAPIQKFTSVGAAYQSAWEAAEQND